MYKRGEGKRLVIDQRDLAGCLIKTWSSMAEASRELGISQQMISKCARGLCSEYKGCKWVKVKALDMVGEYWLKHPTLDIQCSNMGRIKNKGIISAGSFRDGYIRVGVNMKVYSAHRLVAETFHGLSSLQVNHKNKNRSDNRAENLEWVTPKENSIHRHK